MHYYQVLPELKLPVKFLTYFYPQDLPTGQVVKINIRGKIRGGLIVSKIAESQILDISKIKEIQEIEPIIFNQAQINFLFAFAYNTFNSPNNVLAAMLNPLDHLAQKYWTQIKQNNLNKIQNQTTLDKAKEDKNIVVNTTPLIIPTNRINEPLIEFSGPNISLRIIYLIRSQLSKKTKKPILIIFPEKKQLFGVFGEALSFFKKIHTNIYLAEKNIDSQKTVVDILNNETQVILATRQGLFLPWIHLSSIIIVDEANSLYIQDQNQLYYDTRDAAFFLSQAFVAKLTFLSTLPSIRLHNFHSTAVSTFLMSKNIPEALKPLKIKIIPRKQKNSDFKQLLNEIEQEDNLVFSDEEFE